jgi:hypothetical protein
VPLQAAIGTFFVEFSAFESQAVRDALRALSKDSEFVRRSEEMLEFQGRLTLLQRLAHARGVSPPLIGELEKIVVRARKLEEQREEVAATLAASHVSVPTIALVEDFANEAIALRGALHAVTQRFDS